MKSGRSSMIINTGHESYYFDGSKKSLCQIIRRFKTNELLKRINKESIKLIDNQNSSELPCVERVCFTVFDCNNKQTVTCNSYIQAWSLIDLAYYSIKFSNDFRGKEINYDEELYMLHDVVNRYREKYEQEFFENSIANTPEFMFYLWGFGGEQFKFQQIGKVVDNATRELYIIFEMSKKAKCEYDFHKIIKEEIGTSWENVISSLFIIYVAFFKAESLGEALSIIEFKEETKKQVFINIINKFTSTYDEVRNAKIGRQILYAKPFIKTQKNEIIQISPYLTLSSYEHCIFWTIRNHFKNKEKDSLGFVNSFGYFFELYFEELLSYCLKEYEYYRIPEKETKSADWFLDIEGHQFLVEQKSSIMMVSAKQQFSDVKVIRKFLCTKIVEAIEQLYSTEKSRGLDKASKIILLYEDYLEPEILDSVFELRECTIENDGRYWIVTIDEMERLLCVAKNDRELFKAIIKEKISRELSYSNNGRSIRHLLQEKDIIDNDFLNREEIRCYSDILKKGFKTILD